MTPQVCLESESGYAAISFRMCQVSNRMLVVRPRSVQFDTLFFLVLYLLAVFRTSRENDGEERETKSRDQLLQF